MDICDTVFSNLSRDMLNHELPSLSPVSITVNVLILVFTSVDKNSPIFVLSSTLEPEILFFDNV